MCRKGYIHIAADFYFHLLFIWPFKLICLIFKFIFWIFRKIRDFIMLDDDEYYEEDYDEYYEDEYDEDYYGDEYDDETYEFCDDYDNFA